MMDPKFVIIIGVLLLVLFIEIVILKAADRRRRRALAEAGPSQGLQPISLADAPKIALVPILEHKIHTWGQVLQGSRGTFQVLLFDYSFPMGKSSYNQTVVAFRSAGAAFPKFQLRSNRFWANAGWGAYTSNRVKFDADPAFGKSYFLAGPDPSALSIFFNPDLRNFLGSLTDPSWTIEGYGNWLVFYRHGKKVKPAVLFQFVDEAGRIAESIFGLAPANGSNSVPGVETSFPVEQGPLFSPKLSASFKFKINGHEVSGGNVATAIEDAILRKTNEVMAAKLENLRCPEHNQIPQLEFNNDDPGGLKIRLKTCCEAQRQKTVVALGTHADQVAVH